MQVGRLWRTVRHLKLRQILGRVRFRLAKPRIDLRPAPPLGARNGRWVTMTDREASLLGPSRLRFLNLEHDLDECGWDNERIEKLWRYNLHYFDDLNARAEPGRTELQRVLLQRWLREVAPGQGTAWEPYPVSLRVVNWIKWLLRGEPAIDGMIQSLAVQSRWLNGKLEWHLLGNHLFVNAKALYFVGHLFAGDEADGWREAARDILQSQISEQILADGGHFELSPMYHALALEDVLDLINVNLAYPDVQTCRLDTLELRRVAVSMLGWLRALHLTSDRPGFFNDTALGIALPLASLERYAADLGITAPMLPKEGALLLDESGYVRMQRGGALALLDVARIGPDYLPAHAHADTLSFEFAVDQRPVIVNGGTSCYGTSRQRSKERGTASHSTVTVAGRDSSEVWSGFRVGRRARPFGLATREWTVECSHDGYRWMPGSPVHHRRWIMGANDLRVEDQVSAALPAIARFLLAPGLRLLESSAGTWSVREGDEEILRMIVDSGEARVTRGECAMEFGKVTAIDCLEVNLVAGSSSLRLEWAAKT